MIDNLTVEKILDASEITGVIQDFVVLKKRGVNYIGLCPFHNEKTPSFTVSPAKGIFKCFGCGKGGNSVNFIMEHEHLNYYEALKYLAKKYHIEVEERQYTKEETAIIDERESLMVVTSYAQKYFSTSLKENKEGIALGKAYLKERQFRDDIIEKFQLGYCLNSNDDFTNNAIKNGYKEDFLVKTGLTISNTYGNSDRFRGRVIFPIHSISGRLYEVTNEDRYREIAYSIFLFTLHDLKDTPIAENVASCSYSPIDNSQIVNANAYRSYVLVEGSRLFQNEDALKSAMLNISFVLQSQREDGSWLYAVNDERDNFIDNFHTCFVLKNLVKANDLLGDERIAKAIAKGFDFYKKHLLTEDYTPKPFAKLSRFNIVKKELYDYAEGISLCLQMQAFDNDAGKITEQLVSEVINAYQKKDGSYYTRISIFNIPNKMPYLRWSQSQLFYALTNYLLFNKEI